METLTNDLLIDTCFCPNNLDDTLKRFWDLESLGIMKDESSVYAKFTQKITFIGDRYQVCLPWRNDHPPLPTNYEISLRRLHSLIRRLKQDKALFAEYDSIIKDQIRRGIVELVDNPSEAGDAVHFLPHLQ